jgi:hypothetical protein
MNFIEWLQLDEIRMKGLHRMFKQEHPDMPRYVQNDLYPSAARKPLLFSV